MCMVVKVEWKYCLSHCVGLDGRTHHMADLTWPDLSDNDLAMAKTTEQPDLVNRFKELWINELMPTLTELKTEIAKQVKFVTERFESKIRDLDKKLNRLETSQSFVSSKFYAFTAGLANTKKN